jgi:hypothetical protein
MQPCQGVHLTLAPWLDTGTSYSVGLATDGAAAGGAAATCAPAAPAAAAVRPGAGTVDGDAIGLLGTTAPARGPRAEITEPDCIEG